MINLTEIKKQLPTGPSGQDRHILREYIQYQILNLIFNQKIATKLSFLGGTAIKICYNSQRYSEDLDFDNFQLTQDEFEQMIKKLVNDLQNEGYTIEYKLVYKGAFRCYLKFIDLLQINQLTDLDDEKMLIQIDTAPHYFDYQPKNMLLQKFDIFRQIIVTPIDIILSQKIVTIFSRKRLKGRDFYDIVFLMGKAGIDYPYLQAKIDIDNPHDLKEKIMSFTKDINFKQLVRDVSPFLINQDQQSMVLQFREYIDQKLTI